MKPWKQSRKQIELNQRRQYLIKKLPSLQNIKIELNIKYGENYSFDGTAIIKRHWG